MTPVETEVINILYMADEPMSIFVLQSKLHEAATDINYQELRTICDGLVEYRVLKDYSRKNKNGRRITTFQLTSLMRSTLDKQTGAT